MISKYFSISGVLGRTEYFKNLAVLLAEFIVVTTVLSYLLDIQNAEVPGAPISNQVASVVFLVLMLLNFMMLYIAYLSAIIRRARDAGSTVIWTSLSLLLPVIFIFLGFIPRKR